MRKYGLANVRGIHLLLNTLNDLTLYEKNTQNAAVKYYSSL